MSVATKHFGTLSSGEDVSLFIISAGDYKATLCEYGASWLSFFMPDRKNKVDDVLLGFSTLSGYSGAHPYIGATVGRFANRIARSEFELGATKFKISANEGRNQLHGGKRGFDKRLWKGEISAVDEKPCVRFTRLSPDGEEGYPGNLELSVAYSLDSSGEFSVTFAAKTDRATPVSLTNHAYFNLRGEGEGTILGHRVTLSCDRYLPTFEDLIPTGKVESVEKTAMDFRVEKAIGADIAGAFLGYDHCLVLDPKLGRKDFFAKVHDPDSGRTMRMATSLPAVQFYSGQGLSGIQGKTGSVYEKFSGFCLEPELFPDSVHWPNFPDAVLNPRQIWSNEILYAFSVE